MSFKSTVIAGAISTLLASFLNWLFGFWTMAWKWFTEASVWAWMALTYTAPVPISVLAALLICLMFLFYRLHSVIAQKEEAAASSSNNQLAHDQSQITGNELNIIKVLAAADGRWLRVEQISSRSQASRIVMEQAIEKLLMKKMLLESHNYLHGASYGLSPDGRDYAIEQGYVK